jgi:hypothetical protein
VDHHNSRVRDADRHSVVAETANATPGNLATEKAVAASITTAEANALQALAVARGEVNSAVSNPFVEQKSLSLESAGHNATHIRRAGFRRDRRSCAEPGPFRNCECLPGARHALKSSNTVHGSCRPRSSAAEAPMAISVRVLSRGDAASGGRGLRAAQTCRNTAIGRRHAAGRWARPAESSCAAYPALLAGRAVTPTPLSGSRTAVAASTRPDRACCPPRPGAFAG